MAIGSTIYKAKVNICDLRRHYYAEHSLTVACHPSETAQRMMLRIISFSLYAHPELTFGKGLSTSDEPDLWQHNLDGTVERWIDLGQPDIKRIKRARSRASSVVIFSYGDAAIENWWKPNKAQLKSLNNLQALHIDSETYNALESLVQKNMSLTINIDEDGLFITSDESALNFQINQLIA